MKVYQTNEIKNIALLGNDGAGKTTLTEALLYEAGIISRRGRITAKNTVSDYFPVEQEYGYSVFSTVFHVEWNGKKLNIIDCPGADDFVGAAMTALNVTDTALLLINGQYGPEVGTQNHFRYTEKLGKPVIFLVNQLDSEKCDFNQVLDNLIDIYGTKVVPIQYPLNEGPNFNSLIDVLLMKKYTWGPEGGAPTIEDIPEEEKEKAKEMHRALVEAAAENDEELMEKFFDTMELSAADMAKGLKIGVRDGSICPVMCGSAVTGLGVDMLMQTIVDLCPVATDMPAEKAVDDDDKAVEVAFDPNGTTAAIVFKTISDQYGKFSMIKVVRGKVTGDMALYNTTTGNTEKLGRLYAIKGKKTEEVKEICCGDIAAIGKMDKVKTGDTLCEPKHVVKLAAIEYPQTCYDRAISPKVKQEIEKLGSGLHKLNEEDPTFTVVNNAETHQTVISGAGDIQIDILCAKLKSRFGVDSELSAPRVAYREKIRSTVRKQGRYKKQTGASERAGRDDLRRERLRRLRAQELLPRR